MPIDIERLGRPEHQNGKKIRTRNESDDKGESECPRFLLKSSWEYGVLGSVYFPESKGNQKKESNYQRCENVS